jgi:catechol 2,3-dioxygenase-like lactoylglutathione lyase family enzyme
MTNSASATDKPDPVFFENSQPILRVEDMNASLRFYVDKLGFKNAGWGGDEFTSVNRDRAAIYPVPRRSGAQRRMDLDRRGRRGKAP